MNTTCDPTTMDLFRSLAGMQLERVWACRYSGVNVYNQLVMEFTKTLWLRVDLRIEAIAPRADVYVVQARSLHVLPEMSEWDRLKLGEFVVEDVCLLRREDDKGQGLVVDSGFCFVSEHGAELSFDADLFPLVFQMRYESAISPVLPRTRIAVGEQRVPQ